MKSKSNEQEPNYEYIVEYDAAALRDLKKLPKPVQIQLVELATNLGINPRPEGVEPLSKYKGLFRVRTGNYRIVYKIEDNNKLVIIAAIGDRKAIYNILENRYN